MCGFVGITGLQDAAAATSLALQAVQHRGQDAAGIGVWNGGYVRVHKDEGMVAVAIPPQVLAELEGTSAIGHVRYPTAGTGTRLDAQPFMTRRPTMILAHNGNVTNVPEIEARLKRRGISLTSRCDAEPILAVLGDELLKIRPVGFTEEDVVEAVAATHRRVRGAYSVVAILEVAGRETMVAFRDPHSIRPGVYGQGPDGAWAAVSETVSLDVLGFTHTGDIPPGCVMFFRRGEEPVTREVTPRPVHHCIFEDIYFARPDSVMEGKRVNAQRWSLGERLAEEWKAKGFEADVVVAVPDTSRPAAKAMAERLGIKNREGFIKNRYSGRTFIMPNQKAREAAHRLKLNPISEVFEGQRVVIVDDSIVRGTTMRRIVQMVQALNPKAVHVAIFSPAVRHPCFYGIDMPSEQELVAAQHSPEVLEAALAERFGADSVTFLSTPGLGQVAGRNICDACFTGRYPVPVSASEKQHIETDRRGA